MKTERFIKVVDTYLLVEICTGEFNWLERTSCLQKLVTKKFGGLKLQIENIITELINEFGEEIEEQVVKLLVKEALQFIYQKAKKKKKRI